ncbi:MAG: hypothetical protein KAS95_01790 [Candidatus Heimdallarchaeota archaeon]|nr:hypothetical protein [Candidatus Heimdallarchaeota archaeon]
MGSEKKVSFPYRGENVEGIIKRLNQKTVTVIVNDQILFRVPYQLLTPKIKPPLKKNMKKNSYTNKEWTKEQNRDYKKSNNTEINLPSKNTLISFQATVKMLAKALINEDNITIKQYSNNIIEELNTEYKLPTLPVFTGGKRRLTRSGNQYYGVHRTRGRENKHSSISVYSRTAKTQKCVAPKTFLRTLIHEWGHHYDRYKLKLSSTYHTKGFYERVNLIYNELKRPLEKN